MISLPKTAKVIQGWFINPQPKLATSMQLKLIPPPIQTQRAARLPTAALPDRSPIPPMAALTVRPPAPPLDARATAVQRHGARGAFAIEAGRLGLAPSGGGRPLPQPVRGKMEAAFETDFSNVRVHIGPQAERIGAIAFTIGSDIYFAPGRYQPDTVQGQQLLGHELAHVMQQRAGRVRNPLGSGLAVVQDHALEAEADRLGFKAATTAPPKAVTCPPACTPRDVRPQPVTRGLGGRYGQADRVVTAKWPSVNATTRAGRQPIQPMFSVLSSLLSAKTDPDPVLVPRDNSPVRQNPPRFGVGEIIDLSMKGKSAKEGKSLKWAADKGTLTFDAMKGGERAEFTVPDGHSQFTLSIKEGSGRDWTEIWTKTYKIVAPEDGSVWMVETKKVGHVQGTPSCGMLVDVYIRPTDVSFTNVEFMEGSGQFSANGCLSYLNGVQHPHSPWFRGVSVDPVNGTLIYQDTTSRQLDTSPANDKIEDPTWSGPDGDKAGRAYRDIDVLYRPHGSAGAGKRFQVQRLETIVYKSGRMYHRKNNVSRKETLNKASDPP